MSKIDDGGIVYPRVIYTNDSFVYSDGQEGLTRRDWLAGLAMQGYLSNQEKVDRVRSEVRLANESGIGTTTYKALAALAYEAADAIIETSKNA